MYIHMAHISMYGKSNMTHRATRPSCDQKPRLSSSWVSCKAASSCAQVGSIPATLYLDTFKKTIKKQDVIYWHVEFNLTIMQ